MKVVLPESMWAEIPMLRSREMSVGPPDEKYRIKGLIRVSSDTYKVGFRKFLWRIDWFLRNGLIGCLVVKRRIFSWKCLDLGLRYEPIMTLNIFFNF